MGPSATCKTRIYFLSIAVIVCRHCNRLAPSETDFRRVREVATVACYPLYAVCPSVHMYRRGSQWMAFSEISYWRLL